MSVLTRFAILARPVFAEEDRAWIESLRAAHDPQAARIGLHVTLAFPAQLTAELARQELDAAARTLAPFACAFVRFEAVREAGTSGGHVYFVPDTGRAEFEGLHARFYRGVFRSHLRNEPPYVPHITVAAHPQFERCVELTRELGATNRIVRGRAEELELVQVDDAPIRTIARAALSAATAPRR